MPMYDFICEQCDSPAELTVKYEERDDEHFCDCGGLLRRNQISGFSIGKPRYQMQAVTSKGEHIKGHFGKTAKRDVLAQAKDMAKSGKPIEPVNIRLDMNDAKKRARKRKGKRK